MSYMVELTGNIWMANDGIASWHGWPKRICSPIAGGKKSECCIAGDPRGRGPGRTTNLRGFRPSPNGRYRRSSGQVSERVDNARNGMVGPSVSVRRLLVEKNRSVVSLATREAGGRGGRLICVDSVLPLNGRYRRSSGQVSERVDNARNHKHGGIERTRTQWEELYAAAGFRITSVIPLRDNFGTSIVEGVKR